MDVLTFLKILTKFGYPNPSILAIANSVDYNLDYFLLDLKKEMGENGVVDFCDRSIEKLTGEKGLRIDMGGPNGDEYVYTTAGSEYGGNKKEDRSPLKGAEWFLQPLHHQV